MGTLPAGLAAWQAKHKKGAAQTERSGALDSKTGTSAAPEKKGVLPKTKSNNPAIIAAVENKKGPVGAGHKNSDRTAAINRWLLKEEAAKGKKK